MKKEFAVLRRNTSIESAVSMILTVKWDLQRESAKRTLISPTNTTEALTTTLAKKCARQCIWRRKKRPCYTGKCFAGLVEMVKNGEIAQGETVIFLHTGGAPGINTPFHRVEIEKEREKYIHIVD